MLEFENLDHSYKEAIRNQHHRQSRIGTILALILLPTGFLLDWAVYPEIQKELAKYRIACEIGMLFFLLCHLLPNSIRFTKILSFTWGLSIELSICFMIVASGEAIGPYYAGLNLVVLAFILLLPLSFFEAVLLAFLSVSAYSITVIFAGSESWNLSGAVNNFYFLISTCFIGCCASYFSAKRRFSEFKLNYELDLRTKELAELDKVKSDFYANISHEFRTPLTLILAPVEDLLAKPGLNERLIASLNHIKENSYRLLRLVNDLLDVQKLEEKKDFLEQQPIKLNSLLANICSGMESLAKRRILQLSYEDYDSPIVVNGDHSALEKIFINLINNSIKFTESGGEIRVRLQTHEDGCLVEVLDTGQGIKKEDLPYIFDRFRQADSSATRKHQGTGLGLALVKELTQLHGGEISAQSNLGKGTRMTVLLPTIADTYVEDIKAQPVDDLQKLHQIASTTQISADRPANDPVVLHSASSDEPKPRLLIVEDEPGIREYLQETLSEDYDVSVSMNGSEGLYKIQSERPDLVILDLMLPIMDGLTVCEAVKNDDDTKAVKILLLTARTDEKSKLEALRKGADDFLTKPFSTVEIKSRLANMWSTSQLQRDVEKRNKELSEAINELTATQGKLIQSEKLNALGRLAAGLLHEVNNPLNFAFATFQLLEREQAIVDDEYAKELMADIRTGMERISAIVKDLKTFAYPETTDLKATFKLQTAVESAMRFTAAKTRGVDIKIEFRDVALVGSQSHIVQVMVNLLENAADAMQVITERPKEISIQSKYLDNGRIQVIFTDNGPGIPEDIKDKIFDPFYTTKDVGAGMGMGLSICHTIIENHEGILAVESEKDSYTTFTFDLGDAEKMLAEEDKHQEELHGERP